jgi:hypothetical protein
LLMTGQPKYLQGKAIYTLPCSIEWQDVKWHRCDALQVEAKKLYLSKSWYWVMICRPPERLKAQCPRDVYVNVVEANTAKPKNASKALKQSAVKKNSRLISCSTAAGERTRMRAYGWTTS